MSTTWTLLMLSLLLCSTTSKESVPALEDVLVSISKLVSYYHMHYKAMNLDAIFGLRFLQGQLTLLLDNMWSSRLHVPDTVLPTLTKYKNLARDISDKSLLYLEATDPKYFLQLKELVVRPIITNKPYRRIDPKLWWTFDGVPKPQGLTEDFSDACVSELLGGGESKARKCQPSLRCLSAMFTRRHQGYSITHQLLYTVIAEQMGCADRLLVFMEEQHMQGGLQQMQLEFCSNIFLEMKAALQMTRDGATIPASVDDLFMEQEMVCAMLGFMEFLHSDWLSQILAWQYPSGCFGQWEGETLRSDHQRQENKAATQILHRQSSQFREPLKFNPQLKVSLKEASEMSAQKDSIQRDVPGEMIQHQRVNVEQEREQVRQALKAQGVTSKRTSPGHGVVVQSIADKQPILVQHGNTDNNTDKKQPLLQANADFRAPGSVEGQPRKDRNIGGQPTVVAQALVPAAGQPPPHGYQHEAAADIKMGHVAEEGGHLNARRKLLAEKSLQDGCLSHKTAVAVAVLSQYLRFLLEPGPLPYQHQVSLNGTNHMKHLNLLDQVANIARTPELIVHVDNDKKSVVKRDNVKQDEMSNKLQAGNEEQEKEARDLDDEDKQYVDHPEGGFGAAAPVKDDDIQGEINKVGDLFEGAQHPQNDQKNDYIDDADDEDKPQKNYIDEDEDEDDEKMDGEDEEKEAYYDKEGGGHQGAAAVDGQQQLNHGQNPVDLDNNNVNPAAQEQNHQPNHVQDHEYEDYINNHKVQDEKQPDKVFQAPNKFAPFSQKQKAGNLDENGEKNADGYNYYGKENHAAMANHGDGEGGADGGYNDDKDGDYPSEDKDAGDNMQLNKKNLEIIKKLEQTDNGGDQMMNLTHPEMDSYTSIGKSYLVLLCLMLALLYVMYRFVRRRRVSIRYKFR